MKIVKVSKYKLVLREPGKDERIIWTGTKKECEKERLKASFSYNSEWLVVEEEGESVKEINLSFSISGIFGFIAACGIAYLCWSRNGKKVYITD